jgi:hypothetical protein
MSPLALLRRMRRAAGVAGCALSWALVRPSFATAQSAGSGWKAAPGYYRVPIVAAASRGVQLASAASYGFTEEQRDAPGAHHRARGSVAAAVTPHRGLDLVLSTSFQHDEHAGEDGLGVDRGSVLSSDVGARLGSAFASDLHLGLELAASFAGGAEVARSLQNPALDAHVVAAYLPADERWSAGALAGFRYDRSASAVLAPESYRPGDRLALGLSAFNAIPLGIGAEYRWAGQQWIVELSGELLVGAGAPAVTESPWRVSAGGRQPLGEQLALTCMIETALSARPRSGSADPLTPIEPRLELLVGVAYRLFDWDRVAPTPPVAASAPTRPPAARQPEPRAVTSASLLVNVTTQDGYPLSDASVELEQDGKALSVPHENLASYRLGELVAGSATVKVSAPRLKSVERSIQLRGGERLVVDVQLEAAPPSGQLQGLVRSLAGHGLRARIRIEPAGVELETDHSGTFLVDVAPGRYEVTIEAPGHEMQRRHVEVKPDGVVILNADLSRAAR